MGASPVSKAKKKSVKAKKKAKKNYVVVSNSSYCKALKGLRIYFEGEGSFVPTRKKRIEWSSIVRSSWESRAACRIRTM